MIVVRTIRVFCTLQFEGFHQWDAAPPEVGYLSNRHRHIFHVRAEKVVTHEDRDVEFITLKKTVLTTIRDFQAYQDTSRWSCEAWAGRLLDILNLDKVEVSEDGENGAVVEQTIKRKE